MCPGSISTLCERERALGMLPAKHRRLEQTHAILSTPEDGFPLPIPRASGRDIALFSLPTGQASPRLEASIFLQGKEAGPRQRSHSSLPSALPRQDHPRLLSLDSSCRTLEGGSAPLLPARKNDSDELRTDHGTKRRLPSPGRIRYLLLLRTCPQERERHKVRRGNAARKNISEFSVPAAQGLVCTLAPTPVRGEPGWHTAKSAIELSGLTFPATSFSHPRRPHPTGCLHHRGPHSPPAGSHNAVR